MSDNEALMAEAYKRGILPPDKKAMYEEAIKRGLINKPADDQSSERPYSEHRSMRAKEEEIPQVVKDTRGYGAPPPPVDAKANFNNIEIMRNKLKAEGKVPESDPAYRELLKQRAQGIELNNREVAQYAPAAAGMVANAAKALPSPQQLQTIGDAVKRMQGPPRNPNVAGRDTMNLPPRQLSPEELQAAERGVQNIPQQVAPMQDPSNMNRLGNIGKGVYYGGKSMFDFAVGPSHWGKMGYDAYKSYKSFADAFKATPGKDLLQTFPGKNTQEIMRPSVE